MKDIEKNVKNLLNSLPEANPFGEKITLVGAVKTQTPEDIDAAVKAGIRCIGDNRVQEFPRGFPYAHSTAARWAVTSRSGLRSWKGRSISSYFSRIR